VYVDTFGTGKVSDEKLSAYIRENFDMRPRAIIQQLNLLRPVYAPTSAYGHFGRKEFAWEKTDRAKEIASAMAGRGGAKVSVKAALKAKPAKAVKAAKANGKKKPKLRLVKKAA
jgi:S-adenosylmethionine synthetase